MEIKGCKDCPFHSYYYNDFGLGDQDVDTCELNKKFNKGKDLKDWIQTSIKFGKKRMVKSNNKYTLDNCQLLKGDISITLNKE